MTYRDDLDAAVARAESAEGELREKKEAKKQMKSTWGETGWVILTSCIVTAILTGNVFPAVRRSCAPTQETPPRHIEVRRFALGETVVGDTQPSWDVRQYHEVCLDRLTTVRVIVHQAEFFPGVRVVVRGRRYPLYDGYVRPSDDSSMVSSVVLGLPPGCARFAVYGTNGEGCSGCSCDVPRRAYMLRVEEVVENILDSPLP